jgi:hypothetical protein
MLYSHCRENGNELIFFGLHAKISVRLFSQAPVHQKKKHNLKIHG